MVYILEEISLAGELENYYIFNRDLVYVEMIYKYQQEQKNNVL